MAKDFTGINNPAVNTATEQFITPEKQIVKFEKKQKKGHRLQLLIPEELYNQLHATAEANEMSMNEICNQLIQKGINP